MRFVEPSHKVTLIVLVAAGERVLAPGDSVEVAGYPGTLSWTRDRKEHSQTLSVQAAMLDKTVGTMEFTATYTRPRGAGRDQPIDESLSSKLEPAVTDVLTKYFAG